MISFPENFTWGAAAASYQIEGAWNAEGKGPSVWDAFSHQKGKVWEGHTGDVACDHYHRYADDVRLMSQMGLHAYRLSVSWPRILPEGKGRLNRKGLAFYDRLIDCFLENGIEPWVTLFHWDYPNTLELQGGWLNPDSPKWFADYTEIIVKHLSDRVEHWMTLNEPQCFVGLGHLTGEHAPGMKLSLQKALQVGHNALIGHGLAVQAIRANAHHAPGIGWAPMVCTNYPATDSPEDAAAAIRAMSAVHAGNFWNNTWWADPVVFGCYPEEGIRAYGKDMPNIGPDDFDIIKQPLDFFGANMYHGHPTRARADGGYAIDTIAPGSPHTHFLWNRTPEILYWGTKFVAERYGLPVVITENGLSCNDWVTLDGVVPDHQRVDFLRRYLLCLQRAVADGIDVRGYFHWSVMDNFEWAEGYKHRFGLIHVDYKTQKRTLKDSAYWYSNVIKTNGACLSEPIPASFARELPEAVALS